MSSSAPLSAHDLTSTQADYMELIYEESLSSDFVRGCNIAQMAGVTRATITATFRSLKSLGLIDYVPYGPIEVTETGKRIGAQLLHTRKSLEAFYCDTLRLPPETAHSLAMQHKHEAPESLLTSLARLQAFVHAHADQWERFCAFSPSDTPT